MLVSTKQPVAAAQPASAGRVDVLVSGLILALILLIL